ncbi:DJ-1 family glyoxalase III [Clostridium rectalis]|uniref:DJ-1 family glyoxalase III n=1 Tax=Clostridium rectalis TaxID=2040295 RepID=UPI000F633466|nr:DJ-1 family glyoxalase III [Clostridium rectalis]
MKNILVILAEGFEEIEAFTVVDILRRANLICETCSLKDEFVSGTHNIKVKCDVSIDDIDKNDYSAVILPGGMPGAINLRDDNRVISLLDDFYKSKKFIGAICAAPIVLAKANIISNLNITSYPGFERELIGANYLEKDVVQDKFIITSRGPATAMEFTYKFLENLIGKSKVEEIKSSMLFK